MEPLKLGAHSLNMTSAKVMAILNMTPDSFSDGGRYGSQSAMKYRIEEIIEEGADIIDIGGESTRPGAPVISIDEELSRIIPAIEFAQSFDIPISVDTSKPQVMREVLKYRVGMINDVKALQAAGAFDVLRQYPDVAVCLMHMQGEPQTMQHGPAYNDVVTEVNQFLKQRVEVCEQQGIAKHRLILDPGFGFGKTLDHNYDLLANLSQLHQNSIPLLVGVSRKSMITKLLNIPVSDSLNGTIAAMVIAQLGGAQLFRVHDVAPTVQALRVGEACLEKINKR